MTTIIDIEFTFEEMISKGYICEDVAKFLTILKGGDGIEQCGISNPKAPDPCILLKSKMNYELVTKFVDSSEWLKDDRTKTQNVNRVYCSNPNHFSAEIVYDWKSKNDP
jgi:hypothetical protein